MPFDDTTARSTPEIALLDKVRDLLATPDKWCKYALEHDRRHCVYGALNLAHHNVAMWTLGTNTKAYTNVERALARETGRNHDILLDIILFNNAPDTKHADILALIDRARDRLLAEVG